MPSDLDTIRTGVLDRMERGARTTGDGTASASPSRSQVCTRTLDSGLSTRTSVLHPASPVSRLPSPGSSNRSKYTSGLPR